MSGDDPAYRPCYCLCVRGIHYYCLGDGADVGDALVLAVVAAGEGAVMTEGLLDFREENLQKNRFVRISGRRNNKPDPVVNYAATRYFMICCMPSFLHTSRQRRRGSKKALTILAGNGRRMQIISYSCCRRRECIERL